MTDIKPAWYQSRWL